MSEENVSNDKTKELKEDSNELSDEFFSALDGGEEQSDSIRKSVKFEDSGSQLEEIILVDKVSSFDDDKSQEIEDEEVKTSRTGPLTLDFLPRASSPRDSDFKIRDSKKPLDDSKSEFQMEEVSTSSSMEAFQFIKRYSTSKMTDTKSRTLVTDAFIYMVIPPDGGFAWAILVVSFLAQAVVDGVIYCVAPIMDHLRSDLNIQNSQLALITSCQTGFYFCCGPIASAAMNKFGFRKVGMTGGLISSLGILIGSFNSNYIAILFSYGVITGCGVGMVWASSNLVIGYYFEKYRPIANGVGSSGSGLGVILFSILNATLFHAGLNWRHVLQFHSGVMFLVALSCIMYKPVAPTKVGRIVEEMRDDDDEDSLSDESIEVASAFYSRVMDLDTDRKSAYNVGSIRSGLDLIKRASRSSRINIMTEKKHWWQCTCCGDKKKTSPSTKKYIIEPSILDRQDIFYAGVADYSKAEESQAKDIAIITGQEEKAKQIAYTFSVMQVDTKKKLVRPRSKFKRAFNMLFDLSLLKMLEFQILILSALSFMLGLNIPYIYSATRSKIPKAAANALSPTLGVVNMMFRIIAGYVSMKIKFHVGYLCGGGAIAGGFFVFLSAFVGESSTWFQFLHIFMFSAGTACFSSLRSIIYVEVLGLEKLTNSFGLSALVMGIGSFAGTAFAGLLTDITKSYMAAFGFAGVCLMIAGILKVLLPHIINFRNRRRNKKL